MATCIACGAENATEVVLSSYDDDAIGIPVTIKNAVIRHECKACGFSGIEVPDPEGLEAAVAVARIQLPIALRGGEIRFLRKACGMTGKEFAKALDVDNAVLSRWENCELTGHGSVADKNIRDVVAGLLYERTPAINFKPGQFTRMEISRLADDCSLPRVTMERVRLKDRSTQSKSDTWDVYDQAA